MWKDNEFHHDGHRLHYVRTAHGGAPLALLHGVLRSEVRFCRWGRWPLGMNCWPSISAEGTSDRAAPDYHVADYVRDAVAWVRECVSQPVVIYGHSLGAMVAAAVAAELPDRVRGAILEDPPFQTLGSRIASSAWQDYFRARAIAGSTEPFDVLVDQLRGVPMRDPATGRTYRLGDVRDAAALRFFASSLRQVDKTILDLMLAGRWLEGYDQQRRLPVDSLPRAARASRCGCRWNAGRRRRPIGSIPFEIVLPRPHGRRGAWHPLARTQDMINLVYSFVESLDAA